MKNTNFMVATFMDNSFATIVVAAIAVAGVILSAVVTYRINQVNRYKSQNEWKREKILFLASQFIDAFHEEATDASEYDGYHPDFIREMVLGSFNGGESEKITYRICMLVQSEDADFILDNFKKMKKNLASNIESDFHSRFNSDIEDIFLRQGNSELISLVKYISNIIKDMK